MRSALKIAGTRLGRLRIPAAVTELIARSPVFSTSLRCPEDTAASHAVELADLAVDLLVAVTRGGETRLLPEAVLLGQEAHYLLVAARRATAPVWRAFLQSGVLGLGADPQVRDEVLMLGRHTGECRRNRRTTTSPTRML